MDGLAATVSAPQPPPLVTDQPALFRANMDRRPFLFHHALAGHPLFTLPRLAKAAEAIIDRRDHAQFVVFDAKAFAPGTGFGSASANHRLATAVRSLPGGQTWLKLSSVNEADPAYAEILHCIIGDLSALTGRDLAAEITWSSLTVFMASPGIVTPYHIDHETNFLLQVQGEKDVCLFDSTDRNVLTETEIERFYAGDAGAAQYKSDQQGRGAMYRLVPGIAIHQPPLAPHWVKNGPDVSISVSIGFCLRSFDRQAKVYQVNSLLRRAGLRPAQPGVSPVRDRIKSAALEFATARNATSRDDILFSGLRHLKASARLGARRSSPKC